MGIGALSSLRACCYIPTASLRVQGARLHPDPDGRSACLDNTLRHRWGLPGCGDGGCAAEAGVAAAPHTQVRANDSFWWSHHLTCGPKYGLSCQRMRVGLTVRFRITTEREL